MEPYNALLKQNPLIIKKMTGVDVGQLRPDFKADIMISDYRPKTPLNSDNVVGHILFGVINEPVHSTIINGKTRMLNHEILGIDEKVIHEKSSELAEKVWKRVSEM